MKITRDIDIRVTLGERSLRIQDDIDIVLSAEEAVASVFAGAEGHMADDYQLKVLLNNFAQFIKAVPDETIAKLSPEARRVLVGFLEGTAKRFYERAPEPVLSGAIEP